MHHLHQELTLDLHADVADWNPNAGFEHLLSVGTYELDETTQRRHGKLFTYQLNLDTDQDRRASLSSPSSPSSPSRRDDASLKLLHTVDNLPGIFDLQCIPVSDVTATRDNASSTRVALALADGSVRIVDACLGTDVARSRVTEEDNTQPAMALFVDTLVSSASTSLTSSYSDGAIHVYDATPDGRLAQTHEWSAHTLEAWMTTWSRSPAHRGNVIFSGGDDAVFQAWDIREADAHSTPSRCFLDRKTHSAGVTCITELLGIHGTHDNTIVTGSYDNTLRLWDWRLASRPVLQTSFDMGGGVWRIKPHPRDSSLLLAATMYDGFKIVTVENVDDTEHGHRSDGVNNTDLARLKVEQCLQYPAADKLTDKTLAYGASWCRAKEASGLVATCSFYDNLLSLWSWT